MLKRFRGYAIAALLAVLVVGTAYATPFLLVGPGQTTPPNAIVVDPSGNTIGVANAIPAAMEAEYVVTLTPAATSAAIQTAEQTFTVTGLLVTDTVYLNGPAPTSLCPPTTARVSAANTIAIGFTVLTAAACTPAAGAYKIVALH